jgi:hypothetical protein
MNILSKIFGVVPKEERDGIKLEASSVWEISPIKDTSLFLRNLKIIMPEGSVLYFEGTAEDKVESFLARKNIPDPIKVAVGTIWPKPNTFHIPLTDKNLNGLAVLIDKFSIAYLCDHIHAYKEATVLLEWHDAFIDDPMYVIPEIDETRIEKFCKNIGSTYSLKEFNR